MFSYTKKKLQKQNTAENHHGITMWYLHCTIAVLFYLVRESIFWGIMIFCPLNYIITSLNQIWTYVTESKFSKWLPAARVNMRVMLTQTQTNDTFVPCVICTLRRKRESLSLSFCDHFTGKMKRKDNKSLSNLLLLFHSLSTRLSRLATSILKSDGRLLYDCLFIFSPSLPFSSPLSILSSYRPLRSNQHGGPKQKRDCLFNWEQHCITDFFPISPLY